MRKSHFALVITSLLIASPAWSYTISSGAVVVGDADDIVAATLSLNSLGFCGNGSSPATEECWAENATGEALDLGTKVETVSTWVTDQDSSVIAFGLATGTGYYIAKNAGGWVLLNNVPNMSFGVLNLNASVGGTTLGDYLNLCQGPGSTGCSGSVTISHVTPFTGGEMEVPEPAPLALLGLGLLGLALTRRTVSI